MPAAAVQDVFHLPKPPTFATVDEERRHRKQRLAAAFRLFSRFGFDEGVAGHITARDPERLDHFWVNPFGMHFGQIRASDLILVSHRGEVVEGHHPVNVAAFAIHSQVHTVRPDVVAAAHAHPLHGKAWSSLGRLLDPITQDACAFFEPPGGFIDRMTDSQQSVILQDDRFATSERLRDALSLRGFIHDAGEVGK